MRLSHLAAGFCLGIAWATAAHASPAITTQWSETTLSQEQCLERAEKAIRAGGFSNIEKTEQSRYGYRGDYTAAVRCVTSKHFVFFVVTGPSNKVTPGYMDGVYDHF